ncbi:hypothetical protein ACIQF6_33560 [Kitasatospora sp. NPDC092948]|uniref:hypothetical protein n=1 Tax=Kitasatospora sp. NPDC092948 TaxID=3364088 RepID=UPI00382D05C0
MKETTTMGTWTSVSKLTVVLETGQHQGALFGGQIGVVISIQPTDDTGNAVTVTTDDLYSKVLLIDFVDASPIPEKEKTTLNWCWERDKKFKPTPGMTPQIKYTVEHADSNPDRRVRSFGVRVDLPNGNTLYSSQNGTYQSSVQVEA